MSTVARAAGRWHVSALAHGEVLTTTASAPGLDLVLLGHPEGYGRAEIEGWLQGLVRSVTGARAEGSRGDPVPPVLREALGGLLFSHGELWNRGPRPCSIVMVEAEGRIAFGWVGDATVEVFRDGARAGSEWVSVRDARGREARAWCGSSQHDARVELSWLPHPGAEAARIEARWVVGGAEAALPTNTDASETAELASADDRETPVIPPWAPVADPETAAADAREVVEHVRAERSFGVAEALETQQAEDQPPEAADPLAGTPPALLEPAADVAPPPAGMHHAQDRPSFGVARWLAQHLGLGGRQEAEAPGDSPIEAIASRAGEASTAEKATAGSSDVAPASEADVPAPAVEAPLPEAVGADTEMGERDRMPPGVPDLIPPTPEPEPPPLESEPLEHQLLDPDLRDPEVVEAFEALEPEPLVVHDEEIGDVERAGVAPARPAPYEEPESVRPPLEASPPAAQEDGPAARTVAPRHPAWPTAPETEKVRAPLPWKKPALWGALVAVLFAIGWVLGSLQGSDTPAMARPPSALVLFLRQVGLAPPRFQVNVVSEPEGAWIAVDGKELSLQAPATLELSPGDHRVDLSFPDLGRVSYKVTGAKNDRVALEAPMWGSVSIVATDPSALVSVALDGEPVGFVPARLDSVAPGGHDLRFSGPGMASWGSTIEVRVGETREVLAYPLQSPATGLLQIRATLAADGESQALDGARVWVDGAPRGVTPLTLELPRGPHSIRVAHHQEELPIQVIDLPGGNQRFATFDFGMGGEAPKLSLKAPASFTDTEPGLISATLDEVPTSEVREMWLHVRAPDDRWRRYPMTLMDAQGSMVGAAPFPVALLGDDGRASYYVSALTRQGDEYFTEMQTARRAR